MYPKIVSTYGLSYTTISRTDRDAINSALDSGKLLLFSFYHADNPLTKKTSGGHWIMCVGRSGDNYYVLESASYYKTDQAYDFDEVFIDGVQGIYVLSN